MSDPDLTPQVPGALPTVDADKLAELAGCTVGDIVEALPDLSDDELAQLVGHETRGKARASALRAIESEQAKRLADAAAPATGDRPPTTPNVSGDPATFARARAAEVDPRTLIRPVLTRDGWVLPLPAATPED